MQKKIMEVFLLIFLTILTLHICKSESSIYFAESINDPLKTWNLPDAIAFPDQAFVYNLPRDFQEYDVNELELSFLPEWLEYDIMHKKLVGVASEDDVGKFYFIEVKPARHLWQSSSVLPVDIFKLEVESANKKEFISSHERHSEGHRNSHSQHAIHCKKNKPVTATSVVINLDYDGNISPLEKVLMLESFSSHYEMPLKALKFLAYDQTNDQNSNSMLVAGPGDYKREKSAVKKNNVVLHWTVGCGSVHKKHLSALQKLETEAKDGVLREVLGHSVVGWFVTNSKPKEVDMRKRRYLQNHYYPTSTATISISPPTSQHSTTAPVHQRPTKTSKTSKGKQERTSRPPSTTNTGIFEAVKSFPVIEVFVGAVYQQRVERDIFSRPFKHLQLTTHGAVPLLSTSWIKVHHLKGDHHLYGVPLWNHQGMQQYVLKATDAEGNEADLKMDFRVALAPLDRAPFELSIVIENLDYERFVGEVDVRMDVAARVASAFGDKSPSDVLMTQVGRGSVDYSWTNKSMMVGAVTSKHRGCSQAALRGVFDRFINASTAHLQEAFVKAMKDFRLTYAGAHPTGDCERLARTGRVAEFIDGQRVPKREKPRNHSTGVPESTHRPVEEEVRTQNLDELLKQVLVPTLLVIALVLLALLIACMAFRMRSNKKADKLSGVDDYIRKGTPVIFAHELDDHPSSLPSKRPLIASAQRSPKPPNYRQHMISATSSSGGNLPSSGKLYVPT